MVEVTQADRDAAASALDMQPNSMTWDRLIAAHRTPIQIWQANRVAQAFAAHRLAARAELLAELSEPTEAMVDAGKRFYSSNHRANAIGIFRAMIAKAGE